MRSAIIVGSDGFLGRNLARRMTELGGWCLHEVGKAAGDLSQPGVADAALAGAPQSEFIFHVVTHQRTGQIQYQLQGELLATNARIHLNVLEAWRIRQPQAKLVSTGSSCAYPESPVPLTEDMFGTGQPHQSVKGYALAKQVLAMGAQTYAEQYGLRHLHCILATLYGPGDHRAPDRSHFVGAMLERAAVDKLAQRPHFSVWGDPSAVREVLYVDDQIDAILAAADAFENRILNCTGMLPVTVADVAHAILDVLDWPTEITTAPGSFSGAAFKLLDSTLFLQATGWKPRISLVEGLKCLATLEYSMAMSPHE